MKRFYLILTIVLLLVFALTFFISSFALWKADTEVPIEKGQSTEGKKTPEFHFAVVAQNTDDPFWQSVRKGVFDAAMQMNAAVEFNGPRFTNIEEELQYLDIAIASRVDGIVTHVLDEVRFAPLIDKAVDLNIPVITIETDAKNSKRQAFIGSNSFKLGSDGGKIIAEATEGKAQVAVLLDSYQSEGENVTQNLRVTGIKDAVKAFPDIDIKMVLTSDFGIFGAEEITRNILNNNTDINTILCTSPKDTIGVAQLVVDLNRVGDITIIGSGDEPDILRYIEKGVVYGTVASNPENMGYESIKSLIELKKKNRTSAYVDTGVYIITKKNLTSYQKDKETGKGLENN